MQSRRSLRCQKECARDKKRITLYMRISANNTRVCLSSRFASFVSAKNRKSFVCSASFFLIYLFLFIILPRSIFFLSCARWICIDEKEEETRKRCSFILPMTSARYHFQASEYAFRHSFIPLRASPTSRFPHDACQRRGYFSVEDSTSIRYIPARIHYRLAEQYTRECITPIHNPPAASLPARPTNQPSTQPASQPPSFDGYIRDCDLRYRKLLSRARSKSSQAVALNF